MIGSKSKLAWIAVIALANTGSCGLISATAAEWVYRQTTDQMRNEITIAATLESDSALSLPPPYDTPDNRATLWLWKIGSTGQQMALSVEFGQFVCDDSHYDTISIKIDDAPIEHIRCELAGNGKFDAIYLDSDVRALAKRLKYSHKIIVEAEFFGVGRTQITFSPAGLDW